MAGIGSIRKARCEATPLLHNSRRPHRSTSIATATTILSLTSPIKTGFVIFVLLVSSLVFSILQPFMSSSYPSPSVDFSMKRQHRDQQDAPQPSVVAKINLTMSGDDLRSKLLAMLDTSIDPCQDFWLYSCGGFIKNVKLTPQENHKSEAELLEQATQNVVKKIIAHTVYDEDPWERLPHMQRLAHFYESCTDTETIDSLEFTPLSKWISLIDTIDSLDQFFVVLATVHHTSFKSVFPLFEPHVMPNPYEPKNQIITLYADGCPLRSTSTYKDTKSTIVTNYKNYITLMFDLAGIQNSSTHSTIADQIVDLESNLAYIASQPAKSGKVGSSEDITYSSFTTNDTKDFHFIRWSSYFEQLMPDAKFPPHIMVSNLQYFLQLDKLIATTPLSVLKNYLLWIFLNNNAPFLHLRVQTEHFNFFTNILDGGSARKLPSRSRTCIDLCETYLSDDVGREFVWDLFHNNIRESGKQMINNIENGMREIINADKSWLDETSRAGAIDKLDKIKNMIGSTENWDEYGDVQINMHQFLENILALKAHAMKRDLERCGKPRIESFWSMSPTTVNAYYDPTINTMVFPAANFLPPFYSKYQPDAYNYGALGNCMGHELNHAFDERGRRYDGEGKLNSWMTPKVAQDFDDRAQCLVQIFDNFSIAGDIKLRGDKTLNENLADLGGVKVAFRAYKTLLQNMSPEELAKEKDLIARFGSYSPEQVYFLGFAQSWCEEDSYQYKENSIKTNVHSLPMYRVLGSLSQNPDFGDTFNCPVGSPMNPKRKCEVW